MSLVHATPHRFALVTVLTALALTALALAGCGRRGPPELAPGTQLDPVTRVIAPRQQTATQQTVTPDTVTPRAPGPRAADVAAPPVGPVVTDPGLIQPPNKTVQTPANEKLNQAASAPSRPINGPAETAPKRPFLLDPLL